MKLLCGMSTVWVLLTIGATLLTTGRANLFTIDDVTTEAGHVVVKREAGVGGFEGKENGGVGGNFVNPLYSTVHF